MALSFQCPECDSQFRMSSAPAAGTPIRCPKCRASIQPKVAGEDLEPTPDNDEEPPRPRKTSPKREVEDAPRARKSRPKQDEEDDSPRPRKSRPEREDEDTPRTRRSRPNREDDDDDDRDDRPRRSAKKKQPLSPVLVAAVSGGGVLLLVAMSGLVWWLAVGRKPDDAKEVAVAPQSQPVAPQAVMPVAPVTTPSSPTPAPGANSAPAPTRPQRQQGPAPAKTPDTTAPSGPKTPTPGVGTVENNPPPMPPVPAVPANVAAAELAPDVWARVQRATAFIQVEAGSKAATGSGFIVRSEGGTGYLVTNYHVITLPQDTEPEPQAKRPGGPKGGFGPGPGPGKKVEDMPEKTVKGGGPGSKFGPPGGLRGPVGPPRLRMPGAKQAQSDAKRTVTVVLNSGTPEEQSVPAEVVAVDGETDLVVLKITGVRNLPAAINSTEGPTVSETLPVYTLGFPGGRGNKAVNPLVTISKGTIAGLRRDEKNRLSDVHINGEVNPGNSGGPIIDAQGRLIGIAVATAPGKQISVAIPTIQLNEMLKGNVMGAVVCRISQISNFINLNGESWMFDHSGNVRDHSVANVQIEEKEKLDIAPDEFIVNARMADPMLKLKSVTLLYAPAPDTAPTTGPSDEAVRLANAKTVLLQVKDQVGFGKFRLPGVPADQKYAFQISYVNAEGKTKYTQPYAFMVAASKK